MLFFPPSAPPKKWQPFLSTPKAPVVFSENPIRPPFFTLPQTPFILRQQDYPPVAWPPNPLGPVALPQPQRARPSGSSSPGKRLGPRKFSPVQPSSKELRFFWKFWAGMERKVHLTNT